MEGRIIGVSLPRSGHHYLAELLLAALGQDAIHVFREGGPEPAAKVLILKHHDLDGSVDPRQPGFFLIQHREPRGRLISEAERQLMRKPKRAHAAKQHGRLFWAHWLELMTQATMNFHDKWLVAPPASSLVVDYRVLCERPAEVVTALLEVVDARDRIARVPEICARISMDRQGTRELDPKRGRFQPRDVNVSPLIPQDLLDATVETLLQRCPIWRS